jgi:hypothetical protein
MVFKLTVFWDVISCSLVERYHPLVEYAALLFYNENWGSKYLKNFGTYLTKTRHHMLLSVTLQSGSLRTGRKFGSERQVTGTI